MRAKVLYGSPATGAPKKHDIIEVRESKTETEYPFNYTSDNGDVFWFAEDELEILPDFSNKPGHYVSVEASPARPGHPRFRELLQEMADLHDRKNADYAGGGERGPLGNFDRVSIIKKLYPGMDWASPLGVALGYMLKQVDALFFMLSLEKSSETGEGPPQRLGDIAVYSVISRIIWERENEIPR